jgi:CRISPR-associated endoribonuclease Cas6
MRLRILFESLKKITLPWDYRTDVTKVVYTILRIGDPDYGDWLHEHGFRWKNKTYRLFVYSDLVPIHWNLSKKGLADVQCVTWEIGSPDKRFMDAFMAGIERQRGELQLFDTTFKVVDMVHIEPMELKSGLIFRTISPLSVSSADPNRLRYPIYLRPDQPEFIEGLQRNLINKWQAFHRREWKGEEFGIRVWNPKQKLIRVFNVNVRAWHLDLQMWGDEELIRFAYDAGLGIRNSQGFGMIEPVGWRTGSHFF